MVVIRLMLCGIPTSLCCARRHVSAHPVDDVVITSWPERGARPRREGIARGFYRDKRRTNSAEAAESAMSAEIQSRPPAGPRGRGAGGPGGRAGGGGTPTTAAGGAGS